MSIKLTTILGLSLLLAACQNPYTGQYDPTSTALAVGAGAIAVGGLGYIAGQNSRPQYYQPRGYYQQPRRYGGNPYYNRNRY